ncbi:MAG: hypothetical protein HQK55_19075 [Deltaproteobacteria bacterium]|nr:hypothetical protein [Deltaproteobacteria bacterium]
MAPAGSTGQILFKLHFVPPGTVLVPALGRIGVDVGNLLGYGVLDHHQMESEDECAASLVMRYPHYVVDHLKGLPVEDITLVTHIRPDLDAVTAAFFCHCLLVEGHLPQFSQKIADYVRDVDRGVCFRQAGTINTVYGIYTGLSELASIESRELGLSEDALCRLQMECGFSLWRYALSRINNNTDLHSSEIFNGPHSFREAQDLITGDYPVYIDDLHQAEMKQFIIPRKDGHGAGIVDGLLAVNPHSLLFKSWARSDNLHACLGGGFTLLATNRNHERYVISINPESPYTLKGLGILLEDAETEKRQRLGKMRTGSVRPGYKGPDPWYDGRSPLHNFSIVDTPHGGTVLTWEEIVSLLHRFSESHSVAQ